MNRPEVTFQNHEEVYKFYTTYKPRPHTSSALYKAMGTVFTPRVTYAEGSQKTITDLLDSGRTLVLASNHTKNLDPCNIAAMANREATFRPIVGNSFIPSKMALFRRPGIRQIIDGLGAVPVYRLKDAEREKTKNPDSSPSYRKTIPELLDLCTDRLNDGQHMAIFAEGERNVKDITKLQPLFEGIGKIVCDATEQPAIVPMAIRYGDSLRDQYLAPDIFVGEPATDSFTHRKEVTAWLVTALQHCIDESINLS
jgi:1-acyl-sn-glycerol-3-phosphate acyltransferase